MSPPKRLTELQERVPDTPPNKVPDLIQSAYELGRTDGATLANERFAEAHMTIAEALRSIGVVSVGEPERPKPEVKENDRRGYGDIIGKVALAIEKAGADRPFGAVDIHQQIWEYDPDITLAQVRSAIKTLTRTDRAERISKGRYRMISSTPAGNGAVSPNSPASTSMYN